jgi:hypothetical protein
MGRALKVGPQNIGMPIGFQSDRMDLSPSRRSRGSGLAAGLTYK